MTDALAVNDQVPGYRTRRSHHGRGFGSSVPVNFSHAKVAREKKLPAPAARIEASPIVPPTVAQSHPPVIGRRIECYEDVVQAFRDRADDLEISRNELDGLTGLADAHCSMLLTKSHMKVFGPRSLPAMLKVLGLRFCIEEDSEQTELTLRRRRRRVTTHAHYGLQFSPISGPVKGWLFGYPAPIAGKRKR